MNGLLIASAIIAAVSFLLLTIFVIITLKSAKQTMADVSSTLQRVETKISGITEKSEQLMETTNNIAKDAEQKLQALDGIANSANHLGQSTYNMNHSIQQVSDKIANPPKKYEELMQKSTILTEVLAKVYYNFQREKEKR